MAYRGQVRRSRVPTILHWICFLKRATWGSTRALRMVARRLKKSSTRTNPAGLERYCWRRGFFWDTVQISLTLLQVRFRMTEHLTKFPCFFRRVHITLPPIVHAAQTVYLLPDSGQLIKSTA